MLKNQRGKRPTIGQSVRSGEASGPEVGGRKMLGKQTGASCGDVELEAGSGSIIRQRKKAKRKGTHMLWRHRTVKAGTKKGKA